MDFDYKVNQGGGLASEGGGGDLFSTVSNPISPLKGKPYGYVGFLGK